MKTDQQKQLEAKQRRIDKLKFDLKYQTERADQYRSKFEKEAAAQGGNKIALFEREELNDELRAKIVRLEADLKYQESCKNSWITKAAELTHINKQLETVIKSLTDAYIK